MKPAKEVLALRAHPSRTRINPAKLLLSKWTAVSAQDRERHFIVVRLLDPQPPARAVTMVELEAVLTKRVTVLPWRTLADRGRWIQGWH